jgi:hypothetical protein
MQEVLERLGISKTRTSPLHPQSDGMVERRYVKAVDEHVRKVVAAHQRVWDKRHDTHQHDVRERATSAL